MRRAATQKERLDYLVEAFLRDAGEYKDLRIPNDTDGEWRILRSLMNIRMPKAMDEEVLSAQDAYLTERNREKGIVTLSKIVPCACDSHLSVWQGDITRLQVDAIVNAANSQMLGCFVPCHRCIDNCIHTFSGIRLRKKCDEIMNRQNTPEPTGKAKITPAYNLPCKYVIHTVGPIVMDCVTDTHRNLLASCYEECLKCADENGLSSIAFCCISTGEFHFPNDEAAQIAVKTVEEYKNKTNSKIKVIFNVFKDLDKDIYERILSDN